MGFFKGIGRALGGGAKGFIASGGNPWAAAAGAGMGLLSGGNKNTGMDYLNQVSGMAHGQLDPYVQQGNEAYNRLLDMYGKTSTTNPQQFPDEYRQMSRNPMEFVDKLMKGYEPSKGYQYQQDKMLGAVRNSAASGGFAGTGYDQDQQADLVKNLLSSDMGQYLDRMLTTQGQGLAGEERRLGNLGQALGNRSQQGFNASTDLASILGTNLINQADLRFANNRQRRTNDMDLLYLLSGMGGSMKGGSYGGNSTQSRLFGGL